MHHLVALLNPLPRALAGGLAIGTGRRQCSIASRQHHALHELRVPPQYFLDDLPNVLEQVEPVSHLHGVRRSQPPTLGVLASSVAAD